MNEILLRDCKMDRRTLLLLAAQTGVTSAAAAWSRPLSLAGSFDVAPAAETDMRAVARPSAEQRAWQDLELGMFIHFGPQTWQDGRPMNVPTPLSEINPRHLDTDQWARTALGLGAKYIVFVAKHQFGFCWWQTRTTEYSIRNTPWKNGKGDVLAEIADSCQRHGLKLGVYVSPRDDHFGAATGGICKTPAEQARYNQIYREQLSEVFSRYGQLVEIWFDGSTTIPTGDLLRRYQPHAIIFQGKHATIRWVGNEDGFAPYPCWNGIDKADAATGTATSLNSDPDGGVWLPNEVDVSIRRPHWFWRSDHSEKVLTEDQLLSIYYRSVGRGAQLLLNIPANTEGLLPDEDSAVATRFGAEIRRRFGRPIAATHGKGASLTLRFPKPTRVDTVVLQEETAYGERIRAYTLEGASSGTWRPLGQGSAVGHKHIQPIGPATVEAIRLTVTKSAAIPVIRTLAAYNTEIAPPADWEAPVTVWAADLAGAWKDHQFAIDITSQVQAAAQYRLRFVPMVGSISALRGIVLKLGGVSEPTLWKHVSGRPDELMLDITGTHERTAEISGTVEGASEGQILLQKM